MLERTRAQWRRPGGWKRGALYLWHRLRRLPDPPERIARGVFAGIFVSFTPIIGAHVLVAALLAWVIRGNVVAALLATVVGNPLTFPLIALISLKTGHWILGTTDPLTVPMVFDAFAAAGSDLWHNFFALIGGPGQAHWSGLIRFWHNVYWPYLVGSILPGVAFSGAVAALTVPLVRAYQRMRLRRRTARAMARHAPQGDDAAAS